VLYNKVDRPDRKMIRFMYVDPEAHAAAEAGEPAPYGTVLIMEDHRAKLEGEEAVRDADGRMVPTDEIANVFVMEKQPGWGAGYPPEKRNGEWEYAWFQPDGSRKTGENVNFDRCFECHKGVADQDFTFTLQPFVAEVKE
jgi:Cytochrome P460